MASFPTKVGSAQFASEEESNNTNAIIQYAKRLADE
jgi:hypothetical protein